MQSPVEAPEMFPQQTREGLLWLAHGKDPNFSAWTDTVQLDYRNPATREAMLTELQRIAGMCDGVRCDMAMLVLNSIFERTWGGRAGPRPSTEYWGEVIPVVKKSYPGFLFIAEAYWGLEWELQQQGFDFCYDKTLYDRLEHSLAESIRLHLCADLTYQGKLLRFIENHDEPRAAATFSAAKQHAVAVCVSTLPGTKLFHEGQLEGRKVRLPVFLARRPAEHFDRDLYGFHTRLMEAVNRPIFHDGQLVAFCGNIAHKADFGGAVPGSVSGQATELYQEGLLLPPVRLIRGGHPVPEVETWHLIDPISNVLYERCGNEMVSPGLYVELGPWNYHFFECFRELGN